MEIKAGSTSQTVSVVLRSATTNAGLTGKVAADLTATYGRAGGTPTAITLSNLGTVTDTWAAGGVIELSAAGMPGTYRLDLPDAAVATGAAWVQLEVICSGAHTWKERFPLPTATAADVLTAVGALTTSVTATLANPAGVKKNTPLPNFPFEMISAATGLPLAGLVVIAQRSLDGAAFAPCTNVPTDIGGGAYAISLSAADLNADTVLLRFSASGAKQKSYTILTEP